MIFPLYPHLATWGIDLSHHLHAGAITDSCSAQWAKLLDLKRRRHTEGMVVVSAFLGEAYLSAAENKKV